LRLADGAHSMVRRFSFSVKFFCTPWKNGSVNKTVEIEGEGMAAVCCAQLFSARGQTFTSSRVARPRLGNVLLSRRTLLLLSEIFPTVYLISLCHLIQKRIVAWGPDAAPVTLAHSAWVVSEADLLSRLWQQVRKVSDSDGRGFEWLVCEDCRSLQLRFALSQIKVQTPNSEWAAQVSLLRPGPPT
jgi:hypothetical protein